MATVFMDRAKILECVEKHGAIVRLVKQARVTGLTAADHLALFDALAAGGIPAAQTTLSGTGALNLILTERIVRMVDEEKTVADVDLVYEHALNDGQRLDAPHYGVICGEFTATVNQSTTNLDGDGNQVTVRHRYPSLEEGETDFPDQTKEQGGEFSFFQPQVSFRFEGIRTTATPWLIARKVVGAINKTSWQGAGQHEWMCTSCSWKMTQPSKFHMVFEFQHNPDTWNPTVVFIDERTGKPPIGLIEDVGVKYIRKHPEINFEALLGGRVQGG